MKFSLEITSKTDLSVLPGLKDVYVTMLPGTDYREVARKADELVRSGYNPIPHFPCLLYTSPSPRDKRQYRMPSSA